jgi:sortase system peptidoglycan-associated protein
MFKKISAVLAMMLLANVAFGDSASAKYGNDSSVHEASGLLSGLALGGVTGGPPGAALGAVIGIVVGNGYFARGQVGNLQASLSQNQLELAAAREEAKELQRAHQIALQELDRARQRSARVVPASLGIQLVDACCDNTALSLHFRTGSSDIESQYENQLSNLVNLSKQMPSSSVEITGYADRNGDANFNLALSQQRTEAVRDFLNGMGIQNSSMKTVAYGETRPLQPSQSLENDFFDRRVIVRLRDTSQQMLSRSTDNQ